MPDPAHGIEARWPQLRRAWRRLSGGDGDGPLTSGELTRVAEGIARLSQRLTRERERVHERYLDDPALLGAYLLFYWPISYAQARSVLSELDRPLGRVLDLGAGPLPLSIAAQDAGAASVLALERVDRATTIGRTIEPAIAARPWNAGIDALPAGPFDTIVAGHLFNELFLDHETLQRRAQLVGDSLRRLDEGGRLVILEPALRDTSRALLELRDAVLAEGAVVLAPCLMQAGCPALHKPSDWCHAERSWAPPGELSALADAASIHKDRLKLSYLVLARERAPIHRETDFRVVSEPLDEKGKLTRVGCGPRGRHRLVLRERDRGEGTRDFAELERGDVVRLPIVSERGDGLRVDPAGGVRRLARAGEPVRP